MTDTIDPQRVRDIAIDCLVNTHDTETPDTAVFVTGIVHDFAFVPAKLVEHRDEVREMLEMLPDAFRVEIGGGWSFLNACVDRNEFQWTGEHRTMEMLFCLGIGMGLAKWLMPKEYWSTFPGGMPYVVVTLNAVAEPETL